jgi:hypothetical protein
MTALKILIVMLAALVAISSAVVVKIPSSQLSDVRSQISDLRSTEEHVTQTELINLVRVKENAVKSNGFLAEDVGESDSFVVLGGDKKADADSLRSKFSQKRGMQSKGMRQNESCEKSIWAGQGTNPGNREMYRLEGRGLKREMKWLGALQFKRRPSFERQ